MEFLRPELVWVDGSCYRLRPETEFSGNYHEDDYQDEENEENIGDYEDEDEDPIEYEIEYLSQNRYKSVLTDIPSGFYGSIIGKKGSVKNRMESDLNVKLKIPKLSEAADNQDGIIINGSSKSSIKQAIRRITLIVATARSQSDFTHFLSIPLNSPEIQKSFLDFKSKVCENNEKIDEGSFQNPSLLHLTLGTLTLMDAKERHKAVELLKEAKDRIIEPIIGQNPLKINISDLKIMNDDPSSVDVLYAGIESEQLQIIADDLVELFVNSGLMNKQFDRVKLHCTLLNTIFISNDDQDYEKRSKLDVRSVLNEFSGYVFGKDVRVEEIHLSQRRAGKRSKENYYFPSGIIKLNSCG